MRSVLPFLLLAVAACRTVAGPGAGMNLSSEASDYSPTARLAVVLAPRSEVGAGDGTTEAWRVRVDSAVLAAPGTFVPGAPPIMRDVRMAALFVRFGRPIRDSTPAGIERPWTVLARSAEVPVADSLRYGERLGVAGPLSFSLPPVRAESLGSLSGTGLVFEITAAAVSEPVRMADGTLLPGRTTARGVRVYACSSFRIDGRRDRRRARELARRYTAIC